MAEILDLERLEVLINEVFWKCIPRQQHIPFKGDLVLDLGLDSLEILDLAAEFHFRFDMLSGDKDAYLLQYKHTKDWLTQIHKAANDPNKRFGFFSSGTSGTPKEVWHSKNTLIEERDFWLTYTQAEGLLCLVPVRHIYGFIWGLLLGSKLKQAKFLNQNEWHKIRETATDKDLIIGHPTAWQYISPPFPHLLAVSSTAPIEKALTDRLRHQNIKGMNIYGSTETAGIAYQKWKNNHFELLPYWKKDGDKIVRHSQIHTIPDHLSWTNQREFRVIGRKDKMIQIGGENVSIAQVQKRLKEVPGIREVWVKPYEDHWGTRLYSYFQLEQGILQKEFEEQLQSYLKTIPSVFKPRKWDVGYSSFSKFDK